MERRIMKYILDSNDDWRTVGLVMVALILLPWVALLSTVTILITTTKIDEMDASDQR